MSYQFKVGDRVIPSEEYKASLYYGKGIIGTITVIDFGSRDPITVRWDDGITYNCYRSYQLAHVNEPIVLNGHPRFYELTKKMNNTHSSKNHDYAKGGDALGNFKRVSAIKRLYPNMDWSSPVGVCLGYLLKQLDCGVWMVSEGYEPGVENFEARMVDVSNYSLISIINKEEE